MSIEELRRESRLALHAELARPALYYASGEIAGGYVPITVRLHTKMLMIGDMKGTSFAYAETTDQQERLVFLVSEVADPTRHALVVLTPIEGYWVDTVEDRDGVTVKATVLQAAPAELTGFAAPP